MVKMTIGINKNTLHTANEFFNDIKTFIPGKANYELQLYPRVEKFFFDMNKLGKKNLLSTLHNNAILLILTQMIPKIKLEILMFSIV